MVCAMTTTPRTPSAPGSTSSLRAANQSRVLGALRSTPTDEAPTQAELARLTGLAPATVSLICERHHSRPWGLAGGSPGAPGESWLLPGGDESGAQRLLDKCTLQVSPGDVLRTLTPGGGGWGR